MLPRSTLLAALLLVAASEIAATADEPQFLGRTREQWIGQLESTDRRQRTHAAWAMSEFAVEQTNPEDAMLWLNELLILGESPGLSVRYWGVIGLGRLAGKLDAAHPAHVKAVEALQHALADASPGVRIAAAEWLGLVGGSRKALPVLVEAMSHEQETVRVQAVSALEHWGEAARPALSTLRSATSDPSEYVKRISTRTLERLDGKSP